MTQAMLVPQIDELPDGTLRTKLPTPFPVGPVNCYLLFGSTVTVIDPGMVWRDSTNQPRVAVMMPNILQYPVAVFGILRAGMTVVSVNPLYTARELEHQLRDAGASVIVIFESAAHTLQSIIANTPVRHVVVAAIGDMLGALKGGLLNFVFRRVKKMVPAWRLDNATAFPATLAAGALNKPTPVQINADSLAFLQYTGGTTGVSKGAMLHHSHVLANLQQVRTYFGEHVKEGEEIAIAPLPFYHILALVMNCMMGVRLGSHQILIANPRDIPRLIATLAKSRFSFFVGVNTLFNALTNHPDFARVDFSNLRICGGGGAPSGAPWGNAVERLPLMRMATV